LLVYAQNSALKNQDKQQREALESKVIEWRRDFHQNPELGNREFKTAKNSFSFTIARIEVQTGVAKTGVVGILKRRKARTSSSTRADIDAYQ
jgi:metal-dependent amidase/aminoacylase/carboxypeptidase family protein